MYNKLFTKILDSSIWLEPSPTRIVWLTLIAVMDDQGFAQFASVANVAHRARVTLEEAQVAMACLEGPDPDSSDPDNEGRRVERVPGGWLILNAEKHKEMVSRLVVQEHTRERVRRYRERLQAQGLREKPRDSHKKQDVTPEVLHVTGRNLSETETETETREILIQGRNASVTLPPDEAFAEFQALYPANRRQTGYLSQQAFLGACDKAGGYPALKATLEQHKRSQQWQNPAHVPNMRTWLEERFVQVLPEPENGETARAEEMAKNLAALEALDRRKAGRG
jgi:hypothetical protein